MQIFGFGKKNIQETTGNSCACGGKCGEVSEEKIIPGTGSMEHSMKVLGSGCAKCRELEANTKTALEQLGLNIPVEKITDFSKIVGYGVMSTPALVLDEKVVSYGKMLTSDDIKKILQKNLF